MSTRDNILWFKTHFAARMAPRLAGTPFDIDRLTAIACQETGSLWGVMRTNPDLTPDDIAALCCGDSLDADKGRSAFPRTKADLLAVANGPAMFAIARQALLDMADQVPGYAFAKTNTKKFAHGFGVFQYDLQFFLTNPDYFLNRRYEIFENSLDHAIGELKTGLKTMGLQNATSISDLDFCHVAICYNTGHFTPSKGLKQGHQDNGVFYGEAIRDYLALARTVATPGAVPVTPAPPAGTTTVPSGGSITATGPRFVVETTATTLRLRAQPSTTATILAEMPDGQIVTSVTGTPTKGFIEIETVLGGKLFHGFSGAQFLKPVTPADAANATSNATPSPAAAAIPPAILTAPAGTAVTRAGVANALDLNEANLPRRTATDLPGLRADLAAIIDYLAVDDPDHKRYQPRDGITFCNIYAHDYCTLAGAYLPRVWWTGPALLKLAAGQSVTPKLASTVDEVRANDLFRWLRDFGQAFGWRRCASLTELQGHADVGGLALIVARRKEDGRSGHIVCVVPETFDDTCKRDAMGFVTLPVQSQAGAVNFRYGRSTPNWWLDAKFAEAAFWIHA